MSTYPYRDLDFPTAHELARDDHSDAEMLDGFREALADGYADAVWHAETPFANGHGVAKFL